MSELVFTCPSRGQDFTSYIHSDRETLARVGQMAVKLACPVCGTVHSLLAKDGRLVEAASADKGPSYPSTVLRKLGDGRRPSFRARR